jgi:HD-like signal output (HDOD) protein
MPFAAESTPGSDLRLRERAMLALSELPAFTPILSKLLATLGDDDISVTKLGDLIEKDAVLTGNVLHLVNSGLYARRSNITSVRHAISFLGVNKLRNAVLAMSVARMWKRVTTPVGWSRTQFNTHSAAVAIMSDVLTQHIEVADAEAAFVGGLLHDIGHLLIAWSLPQRYATIRDLNATGIEWDECEREILGFTHADLSGDALDIWALPPCIVSAVRAHHDAPTSKLTVGRVIGVADRFVNSIGLSVHSESANKEHSENDLKTAALSDLGIDVKLNTALALDFQAECDALLMFMS